MLSSPQKEFVTASLITMGLDAISFCDFSIPVWMQFLGLTTKGLWFRNGLVICGSGFVILGLYTISVWMRLPFVISRFAFGCDLWVYRRRVCGSEMGFFISVSVLHLLIGRGNRCPRLLHQFVFRFCAS